MNFRSLFLTFKISMFLLLTVCKFAIVLGYTFQMCNEEDAVSPYRTICLTVANPIFSSKCFQSQTS